MTHLYPFCIGFTMLVQEVISFFLFPIFWHIPPVGISILPWFHGALNGHRIIPAHDMPLCKLQSTHCLQTWPLQQRGKSGSWIGQDKSENLNNSTKDVNSWWQDQGSSFQVLCHSVMLLCVLNFHKNLNSSAG
jgi:hypothetical protein